jgi:hypothetical protein
MGLGQHIRRQRKAITRQALNKELLAAHEVIKRLGRQHALGVELLLPDDILLKVEAA